MSVSNPVVPDLEEEISSVRKVAHSLTRGRLPEVAAEAERSGRVPREMVAEMGRLGLLGLGFPEERGGSGGSWVGFCVGIEELYRVSPGVAASASMASLIAHDLCQHGSAEQVERYVRPLLEGRAIGALALTEPDAGSDLASIRTKAVRTAAGWVISGEKMYITNGGLADVVLVLARTPEEPGGGLTAFVMDLPRSGVSAGRPLAKLGWRSSETNGLTFEDCVVPSDAVVGEVGQGSTLVKAGLTLERVAMAAGAVGLAQGAVDQAVAYAQTRAQFGRPIGQYQAVRHTIAQCAAQVEAARRLTYHAARLVDDPSGGPAASMAKLVASQMCQTVAQAAVQVHGGAGFTQEFKVEQYLRDSMIMTIGAGTSEMQLDIIGRALGLQYDSYRPKPAPAGDDTPLVGS